MAAMTTTATRMRNKKKAKSFWQQICASKTNSRIDRGKNPDAIADPGYKLRSRGPATLGADALDNQCDPPFKGSICQCD
uniref:Uncharacterized protein n=1 Tax=Oryza rufipogon TaxID=4529 RepID=A0A0E0QEL3_ORYRU